MGEESPARVPLQGALGRPGVWAALEAEWETPPQVPPGEVPEEAVVEVEAEPPVPRCGRLLEAPADEVAGARPPGLEPESERAGG